MRNKISFISIADSEYLSVTERIKRKRQNNDLIKYFSEKDLSVLFSKEISKVNYWGRVKRVMPLLYSFSYEGGRV